MVVDTNWIEVRTILPEPEKRVEDDGKELGKRKLAFREASQVTGETREPGDTVDLRRPEGETRLLFLLPGIYCDLRATEAKTHFVLCLFLTDCRSGRMEQSTAEGLKIVLCRGNIQDQTVSTDPVVPRDTAHTRLSFCSM